MRPLTTLEKRAKAATRELHEAVDGLRSAGTITGKSHTMHGFYQSLNKPEFSITINDVLKLERIAMGTPDFPQVTRLLCENAGGIFVPLPDVDAGGGALALRVLGITEKVGVLARDLTAALADGEVNHPEIVLMRADLRALMEEALSCDEQLKKLDEVNAPSTDLSTRGQPP